MVSFLWLASIGTLSIKDNLSSRHAGTLKWIEGLLIRRASHHISKYLTWCPHSTHFGCSTFEFWNESALRSGTSCSKDRHELVSLPFDTTVSGDFENACHEVIVGFLQGDVRANVFSHRKFPLEQPQDLQDCRAETMISTHLRKGHLFWGKGNTYVSNCTSLRMCKSGSARARL